MRSRKQYRQIGTVERIIAGQKVTVKVIEGAGSSEIKVKEVRPLREAYSRSLAEAQNFFLDGLS
jgi:hypothetical protein